MKTGDDSLKHPKKKKRAARMRAGKYGKNNTVNGIIVPGYDTKLSPELRKKIVEYIKQTGAPISTAAEACGVMQPCMSSWMSKGNPANPDARPPYSHLYYEVTKAYAELRGEMCAVVTKDARQGNFKGGWLPAMTYLERTDPEHFARRPSSHDDTPIQININLGQAQNRVQIQQKKLVELPAGEPETLEAELVEADTTGQC